MKRYAWCTDTHLDHVDREQITQLASEIRAHAPDGLFITGDVSNSLEFNNDVSDLRADTDGLPIMFVAGNHDYWGTSFKAGREQFTAFSEQPGVHYMTARTFVPLTKTTAVVGHDGWYDAMHGNWHRSQLFMNDWRNIEEFRNEFEKVTAAPYGGTGHSWIYGVVSKARSLADEAAQHVSSSIDMAVAAGHKHVIVLTHFPPFKEVCRYNSRPQETGALPWYTSKLMGDALLEAAQRHPSCKFTVLCGHTHESWTHKVARNMEVHVGSSCYGAPSVQPMLIEVD